jgi:hypothetical protein
VAEKLDSRARELATGRPARPRAVPALAAAGAAPTPEPAAEPAPALVSFPSVEPPPPSVAEPVTTPPPDRRGVLAAFMEEKNILWGEVAGGLLIVGCSIALVLSLWKTLEALPYFPFLLATGITAALFGAGQYTLHHWKLAATSKGLLVIALLLAPLNLLLLANPGTAAAGGWVDVAVRLAAVLVFVGIVRTAGRDLIGTDLLPGPVDRRWLLALAVVGAPASHSLPAEWVGGGLAVWLPLGCFLAACGAMLAGVARHRPGVEDADTERRRWEAVLGFAGLSMFALFAAWGLTLIRSPDVAAALLGFALPAALAAVPVVEAGLLVQRRAADANWRTAGTGTAVAGSLLLAGGVVLAWPDPLWLMFVAAVAGAVFALTVWRDRLPWFQAGVVPAFGLAAVLAAHGALGHWLVPEGKAAGAWLKALLGSSDSGVTLVGYALLLAAVAELIVRRGNRPQAAAAAIGGLAAGAVGLFLTAVHGQEQSWPAAGVSAACAAGLLAANLRWKRRAVAQAGVWLGLVATLWTLGAVWPEEPGAWGLTAAVAALVLAAVGVVLMRRSVRRGRVVLGQLRTACGDVAMAAGHLAVLFAVFASSFPYGRLHTVMFLVLVPVGLLLTRLYLHPWPTWAASAAALFGLVHLTVFTGEVRPVTAAVLLALLGHATLGIVGALALRGKRRRTRLFADPLRHTARLTSVLAALLVLVPVAGFAPEWAGFAAWLAVVWFVLALVWREPGAFSAANGALAAAAVFAGLSWVEQQEWWATTPLGAADPRALQAFGVALAALGLVWVAARRAIGQSERLRALWLRDPFAVDRLVLAAVVVSQLVLLATAISPAARAEHTPLGFPLPHPPTELTHAFGQGTWLLLGLLAVGLVSSLRLSREDEPGGDALTIGLVVLGLGAMVAWAGTFAGETAAATALRWGLAAVFLVGVAVLWDRDRLGRFAMRLGFRTPVTSAATIGGYGLLGAAAVVVVLQTIELTQLGLAGRKPGGPAAGSVFAVLGYTKSFLVPLALLVFGLAGTALRERQAGPAFAGGLVFVGAVSAGYALVIVTGGGSLGGVQVVRLIALASGSAAAWALLWLVASRRVPGGPLLAAQVTFGPAGIGLLAAIVLARLFNNPASQLPEALAEFGRSGWAAIALAAVAAYWCAARQAPAVRAHVVGFALAVVGVLAAAAVQSWDEPGRCVSFHTLAAVWAAAGLGLTAARFAAPSVTHGAWAAALAGGVALAALTGPPPAAGRWPEPLALAAYAAAAAALAARFGRREPEPSRWGGPVTAVGIAAAAAVILALSVTVTEDRLGERLSGPAAVLLLVPAAAVLAGNGPAAFAGPLRLAALLAAAIGLALVGWAVPDRGAPALWAQRNGWAFVALAAGCLAAAGALPRLLRAPAWAAARGVGGGLGAAALLALVVVLLQQVLVFDPATRRTPLGLPEVLAIVAAVAGLMAFALRFALRPAADPLALPETRRTTYVYLAEVLLVLLFAHVRLNLPELFLPAAVRYWTFLVMLLAFVGIGLAELFERRGVAVFAVPLRRTGVLLPLVPLLAFWTKPPAFVLDFADARAPGARPFLGYLEKLPQYFDNYAGLWFLAGLLYGLVALSRRSFGWALLAALAANAGVWALLAHTGVSAAVHPQVWVIPLALIVLVSEHVNRRQLRPDVAAGLRYLGTAMLYVASAADMFIAGVGNSVWLPVVLAVFAAAGIAAGIALRVRAFLFLGAGFLLLDVFAMIWHAAVDRAQTWVWYASGIVLGVAILAVFALFEKRRDDVRGVVDRVRTWD